MAPRWLLAPLFFEGHLALAALTKPSFFVLNHLIYIFWMWVSDFSTWLLGDRGRSGPKKKCSPEVGRKHLLPHCFEWGNSLPWQVCFVDRPFVEIIRPIEQGFGWLWGSGRWSGVQFFVWFGIVCAGRVFSRIPPFLSCSIDVNFINNSDFIIHDKSFQENKGRAAFSFTLESLFL